MRGALIAHLFSALFVSIGRICKMLLIAVLAAVCVGAFFYVSFDDWKKPHCILQRL